MSTEIGKEMLNKKMAERAPGVGDITNLAIITDSEIKHLSDDKIDAQTPRNI